MQAKVPRNSSPFFGPVHFEGQRNVFIRREKLHMGVKVPTSLWAKVLLRAVETDQKFPWIRQVEFYLDSCIAIDDSWTTVDLERAEHREPTRT